MNNPFPRLGRRHEVPNPAAPGGVEVCFCLIGHEHTIEEFFTHPANQNPRRAS